MSKRKLEGSETLPYGKNKTFIQKVLSLKPLWQGGIIKLSVLLVAMFLLAGCGGLGGEPPIVSTLVPVTATIEYPTTPPDLAVGASIFAERCTRCHGLSGQGDGDLIGTGENQITNRPASFRDAATTADQTPLAWYQLISNGNIEKQMPPWKDALSADERWAVALYTYTLHTSNANVEAGAALTAANPVTPANLPSIENSVKLTDAELITQAGLPDAFINNLSDQQKIDLAAYLRSLMVANAQHMGLVTSAPQATQEPVTTPEVTPEVSAGTGTVSGQVKNGTAGASVPADLKVDLYIVTARGANAPIETSVSEDGRFSYANIDIRADQRYVVTINYKGRAYGSEAKSGDAATNTLDLPLTIYETTNDASAVSITAWVSQIQLVGSNLQITDFIQFTNSTDKAYSTDTAVDAQRFAGVQVSVPNDAQILSADVTNPRYTVGADGRSVIDTAPVLPGDSYIFQMAYNLPYRGDVQVEQPVSYTLSGVFRILLNVPGATITSDMLTGLGPQDLSGVQYQAYGASMNLKSGDSLRYNVQGGTQTPASNAGVVSANQLIPLLVVGVGLIAIITAVVLYWHGRPAPSTQNASRDTLVNGLIQQIAELDKTYRMGSLDEEIYQKRRQRLKAQLAALLDEEK